MISAVSALANDGKLMQPYVVSEIHDEFGVRRHEPADATDAAGASRAVDVDAEDPADAGDAMSVTRGAPAALVEAATGDDAVAAIQATGAAVTEPGAAAVQTSTFLPPPLVAPRRALPRGLCCH